MFEFSPEWLSTITFFLDLQLHDAFATPKLVELSNLHLIFFENTLFNYAVETCCNHVFIFWHVVDLAEINQLKHLFISQLFDSLPANWDVIRSVYHYTVPTTKLYYPEPFIAASSFLHTDLWFSHITVYMYWLWFAFCFLITFFFITFVCTLRWCNPRMRPRRETRGVSRSKCGDLITAIVPVSWATSIIIHESTDSIDLYDGSGTNEISIGIRAYQWGWEYYYPRSLDLNHRLQSYGIYGLGTSYTNVPNLDHLNDTHRFLNEYQTQTSSSVNETSALLFLPHINPFWLPIFDISTFGRNAKQENSAFQSMHQMTKHVSDDLISVPFLNLNSLGFDKLFIVNADTDATYNLIADRSHLYISNFGVLNSSISLSDIRSIAHLQKSWQNSNNNSNQQNEIFHSSNYLPNWQLSNNIVIDQLFSSQQTLKFFLFPYLNTIFQKISCNYATLISENFVPHKNSLEHLLMQLINFNSHSTISSRTLFSIQNVFTKLILMNCEQIKTYKNLPGSTPQLTERSIRSFPLTALNFNNIRFNAPNNVLTEHTGPLMNSFFLTSINLLSNFNSDFVSTNSLFRLAHANFTTTVSNPIVSNNPFVDLRNYDLLSNSTNSVMRLYHGREDMISEQITEIFKNMWTESDSWAWRTNNAIQFNNQLINKTWPIHFSYFDADFRKWSYNQFSEDNYWDAYFNNQGGDVISDYMFNTKILDTPRNKFVKYLMSIRYNKFRENKDLISATRYEFYKPFLLMNYPKEFITENSRSLINNRTVTLQNDDGISNSQIMPRKGLSHAFISATGSATTDDAYSAWKYLHQQFTNTNLVVINRDAGLLRLQNFITMFDVYSMSYDYPTIFASTSNSSIHNLLQLRKNFCVYPNVAERRYNRWFRSLYFPQPLFIRYFVKFVKNRANIPEAVSNKFLPTEQFLLINTIKILNNIRNLVLPWNLFRRQSFFTQLIQKSLNLNQSALTMSHEISISLVDQFNFVGALIIEPSNVRIPASFKMLSNVSHAATGYNAVQKVYRTQYDEARSNIRLRDFSMAHQPIYRLSERKFDFFHLIKKSGNSFYQPTYYLSRPHGPLSNLYAYQTALNTQEFDFPFRLAVKSDPARYLWIDWWANWGVVDIQPASFSRYALYGLPIFAKAFEYSAPENDTFTEGENYFTRLSRARRSLLSSWVSTPYFYAKANHWFVGHNILEFLEGLRGGLNFYNNACNICFDFFTNPKMTANAANDVFTYFFPALSLQWSPARKAWHTYDTVNSYYNYGTKLADILTKRELLMRNLLLSKNSLVKLPFHYTASPAHPLFKDLRTGLLFADKQLASLELTHANQNATKLSFEFFAVQSFYEYLTALCPYNTLTNYLMNLIMSTQEIPAKNSGLDMPSYRTDIARRSQYRSIKKGVSNMVRLHATGAMALPVVTRLHIFASSRDVIHSWAIPSAGIKIDCIPGFSSHRMAYFISTGIFWGQCMEVCGRYHHWMPIVVYFMKKDIFLLWCTHFVFLKHEFDVLELLDQHSTDFVRTVSHEPENWLSEFQRKIQI